MDEMQATPAEESRRWRPASAQLHGNALLSEAVQLPFESSGAAGIDALRERVRDRLAEHPDHERKDDRTARLAFAEVERTLQLAERGASALRGWTEDAAPSVEEQQ